MPTQGWGSRPLPVWCFHAPPRLLRPHAALLLLLLPPQVVALEGLCNLASADDKNTWRVEIDLGGSGLEYQPGDALGVWPTNCPEVGCCC